MPQFLSTSSSFYWASVANAQNVLQPYWLIVLPLDVPDLTASLLLWGPSGQRWRCLWTFLFSIVPTFATSRLQEILAAKGGTTWARNGRWILPENARLPRNIRGSFTCRKSTTWDRWLYFPSEGRRAEDFFTLKNPAASVGFEPTNLGPIGRHATSRPPKQLYHTLVIEASFSSEETSVFSTRVHDFIIFMVTSVGACNIKSHVLHYFNMYKTYLFCILYFAGLWFMYIQKAIEEI